MSSKNKDSRKYPRSSSKAKDHVKNAPILWGNEGFELGHAMTGSLRNEDIERIMLIQNKSLKNFARTNELLGKFNDFSSSKYDVLQHMFLQHTRILVDLKKDLTNVFLRIRGPGKVLEFCCGSRRLKARLQKQLPDAFQATFNLRKDLEDRLEKEDVDEPTYVTDVKEKNVNKGEKAKSLHVSTEADKVPDVRELNLNSKVEHEKTSNAEFTENLGNCESRNEKSACRDSEESEDENLGGKSNQSQEEINLDNTTEMSDGSDEGKDLIVGTKVITGDCKDCQLGKNNAEIENTADDNGHSSGINKAEGSKVISENLSKNIEDHNETIKGDLEVQQKSDGEYNKVIGEDLEETKGLLMDFECEQRIQDGPDHKVSSDDICSSAVTAEGLD